MEGETSLRSRSLRSVGWRLGASLAGAMVLFVRAVVLARLVAVETFGVYALSFALVSLSAVLAEFGLGEAFLHRAPATADEDRAARAHFGWNLLLTLGWAALAAVITLLVATPAMVEPLLVLIAARAGLQLARTPSLILVRRVEQRRLATIDLMTAVATTVVAVGLAAAGAELWALLATDLVAAAVALVALYAWRPVWHPRLDFSPAASRYFLGFGSRGLAASALTQMLERIDNLWTGLALGKVALGYYSRAFTFATYPRRLATQPILAVVEGTFAELKGDPDRLRKAFLDVTFLLTRLGVMAAGLLAVVGEDFVVVLLGSRWLPMLPAFRILLVLAVVTPIERSLAALFVAIGEPGRVAIARSIQLVVVMLGLLAVGRSLGTAGVATAVVFGELAAAAVLWTASRRLVDSSIRRLAAAPLLAAAAAAAFCLAAVRPAITVFGAPVRLAVLAGAFCAVFLAVSYLLDRGTVRAAVFTLRSLRGDGPAGAGDAGGAASVGGAP